MHADTGKHIKGAELTTLCGTSVNVHSSSAEVWHRDLFREMFRKLPFENEVLTVIPQSDIYSSLEKLAVFIIYIILGWGELSAASSSRFLYHTQFCKLSEESYTLASKLHTF
jgi:hypothetical protein